MNEVRCVVFDVDDTLYLERDYVKSGFHAVGGWLAQAHGLEGFAEAAWALFERGVRGTTFDEALKALIGASDPALVSSLVEQYRHHAPTIELLSDAVACLRELEGRVAMAAITDGPLSSQQAKVKALALSRWMQPVICTASLGHGFGKPHPRAFELVQAEVGSAPSGCVYVADNPAKDFAGPRALGWRTVRIRKPLGLHAAAASGRDVDVEITDLTQLPSVVGLVT